MYRKFKNQDLFVGRLKTHPKVEFFLNSGSVENLYYNREIQPSGSSVPDGYTYLSNLVNPILNQPFTNFITAEDGDLLITEDGSFFITEGSSG